LSGYTADKIGRKRTIQLGCIVATIGMFPPAGECHAYGQDAPFKLEL